MKVSQLLTSFLGLDQAQKRHLVKRASPEQSEYSSIFSQVQTDISRIFPQSVYAFYSRTDVDAREYYSFLSDIETQPWFTTLSNYYTQPRFQSLLEHTTDSWYRSRQSVYGTGPLDNFSFIDEYYTKPAVETGYGNSTSTRTSSRTTRSSSSRRTSSSDGDPRHEEPGYTDRVGAAGSTSPSFGALLGSLALALI